jgi:hypothetical protein
MAGIPASNILQPGIIKVTGGATQAIISGLQLLTPQFYNNTPKDTALKCTISFFSG